MPKKYLHQSLLILTIFGITSGTVLGQSNLVPIYKVINGKKANYSIEVPRYFEEQAPRQRNTDISVSDDFGASININVTERLPEEYQITAHAYSREMFGSQYKALYPNYRIHNTEKLKVGGIDAFLIDVSGTVNAKLRLMSLFLYHEDKAFVVTATAEINRFDKYKPLFEKVFNSLKIK